MREYFYGQLFLTLCFCVSLENYDQRLADSCRTFTQGFIGFMFGSALFSVSASLIGNLITISLTFYLLQTGDSSTLAVAIVGYFLLLGFLLALQFSKVSILQFQLNKFEGFFRFSHAKVRACCESIAFYGGELKEKTSCLDDYAKVYHTGHKQARALSVMQATITFFYNINSQSNTAMSTLASYGLIWWMGMQGACNYYFISLEFACLVLCFYQDSL